MFKILKRNLKNTLNQMGKPYLNKIFAEGFPEHLKPALSFLLTQEIDEQTQNICQKIEFLREEMAKKTDELIQIYPSPEPNCQQGQPITVSLSRIATVTSINSYWGTFLYLVTHAQKAKTILELGSCAGISGCYLASSPYCQEFITVECSPSLAKIAQSNLEKVSNRFTLTNNSFDPALVQILSNLTQTIDVAYIDGNHEKIATLHYLERLKPYLSPQAILLFDDIHWTKDMEEAWQIISKSQIFSYTIDLGRLGLCIYNQEINDPKIYSLATYTNDWKRGKAS
jgi:predicted O-methyltransferase YrrM